MKIFFGLFLIIFAACHTPKKTISTVATDDILITYSKTSCRGKCPVFTLTIFTSGKALFLGKENTKNIGNYQTQLPNSEVEALVNSFNKANFFNLKDEYTSHATDLPTVYISYSKEGKTKKVKDYFGAPDELKNLEAALDKIVDSANWVKSN